jgi:hypothetical protein
MAPNTNVRAKNYSFYTKFNPDALKKPDILPGIDFPLLIAQMKEDGIKQLSVSFTEIIEWDMEPMRNFFHGVVCVAFQKKLNATASGQEKPYYNKQDTKSLIKRAILNEGNVFEVEKSTEALTPEKYMEFLNACELLYFNMFNTSYDTERKPTL